LKDIANKLQTLSLLICVANTTRRKEKQIINSYMEKRKTKKDFLNIKQKELLSLPEREWDKVSVYDDIIVCPTTKRHSSGYRLMAIIGCKKCEPFEIAGYCDDIGILIRHLEDQIYPSAFRCDMILSNCIHFHSNKNRFVVGESLSSTDITLEKIIK
jgi:hypothetical protein